MKIRTITCHDVDNSGASLQAYALVTYLRQQGHDAAIIDYKPDYLSKHYSLSAVANPKYDKPVLRWIYLGLKLPERLKHLHGGRKKSFDSFKERFLPLTDTYHTFDELKKNPPEADIYIAGSDQIWNTAFNNGRDPSFYLQFAPEGCIRASYAASFAAEHADPAFADEQRLRIGAMDYVAVREKTGLGILKELGIDNAMTVCDPVFLLDAAHWRSIASEKAPQGDKPYIFVYDFDGRNDVKDAVQSMAAKYGCEIYSVFPLDYADRCVLETGPLEFLTYILNARFVMSNSFHATAFSLILHKPFMTFDRRENLNSRMRDLLALTGLSGRTAADDPINWNDVDARLANAVNESKAYLDKVTGGRV